MNYIKELEQQNEELKQKLANAEDYIYWKNNRVNFSYKALWYSPTAGTGYTNISRITAKSLISIKNDIKSNKYTCFSDMLNKYLVLDSYIFRDTVSCIAVTDISDVCIKVICKKNDEYINEVIFNYKNI